MNDNAERDPQGGESPAETKGPSRPSTNAAVARCNLARQRAYNKEFAETESEIGARIRGEEAFRRAMPPLAGYENICDFIACVTHGILLDVFRPKQIEYLLEASKIALGALRHEPKSGLPAAL